MSAQELGPELSPTRLREATAAMAQALSVITRQRETIDGMKVLLVDMAEELEKCSELASYLAPVRHTAIANILGKVERLKNGQIDE